VALDQSRRVEAVSYKRLNFKVIAAFFAMHQVIRGELNPCFSSGKPLLVTLSVDFSR
jgi:hypothetical protein